MCLEGRVLLVAMYWRTSLTIRRVVPLFGAPDAAAHRDIDAIGRLLALAPRRRRRTDDVKIVHRQVHHASPTVRRSTACP